MHNYAEIRCAKSSKPKIKTENMMRAKKSCPTVFILKKDISQSVRVSILKKNISQSVFLFGI